MTKNTLRTFLQLAVPVLALSISWGLPTHAQTTTSQTTHTVARRITNKSVVAKKNTNKLIEGTFTRTTDGTYTITVASTTYTVEVNTKRILNKGWHTVPFSDFKTGDTVRAYGPITDTTMSALVVRDISLAPVVNHIVKGTVSDLQSDSFTLTAGKVVYTVQVTTPKVLDRVWRKITYQDIQSGNTVRVFGVVTGSTVEGKIVRDITLPKVAMKHTTKTTKTHA